MRGFNFNISSMFGGFGSNSSLGSFNFSDYASIKKGSYGKLMKSYYAEQKKTARAEKSTSSKVNIKKEAAIDKTGLTQMKKEADGLKTAAEVLNEDALWKQSDGKHDMDKIVSAVKTFVKEYNDTLNQATKVNSKDIAQDVRYMNSMTNTMSKALSKIGIAVGTDGKLSVNEDELKKASVTSIKSLFAGSASYGSQISDRASEIARDTVMNSSVYGSNGTLSSSLSNMFNKWI